MIKKLFNGKNLIVLLASLTPLLVYTIVTLIYKIASHGGQSLPIWNDEAVYYALVKLYRVKPVSDGYWGYNAEHAIVGTGAAWNPALLALYTLLSHVIGWSYNSISVCNIIIICISLFLAMHLMQADKRTCGLFAFMGLLSTHIWLYADTQMTELLRYSFAILLAAILYHLAFGEKNPVWFKIVAGLYVLFLTQAYIFFAFAIPIYVLALLKNKKGYVWKVIVAMAVMVIVALPSYYLFHLIAQNYDVFRSEELLECIGRFDIPGMFLAFFKMTKIGVYDLFQCFLGYVGHGLFKVFVPLIAVFTLVPLVLWITEIRNKRAFSKNGVIFLMCAYAMGLFAALYVIVYPLEAFTLFRGLGIPIFFCLTLTAGLKKDDFKEKEKRTTIIGTAALFGVYALLLFFMPANLKDNNAGRFADKETVREWRSLQEDLEGVLQVASGEGSKEQLRYKNMMLLYTMEPRVIAAVPVGIGQNYMLYTTKIDPRAGYLLFSKSDPENLRSDWLEKDYEKIMTESGALIDENYDLLYDNGAYALYKHR